MGKTGTPLLTLGGYDVGTVGTCAIIPGNEAGIRAQQLTPDDIFLHDNLVITLPSPSPLPSLSHYDDFAKEAKLVWTDKWSVSAEIDRVVTKKKNGALPFFIPLS